MDALIEQLGEAESADEIAQIREQLQASRAELAAARSELAGLKLRTDFSTLAVTVVGDGDTDGWSFGDAVDDAGSVLEDLAGATLIALAVLVPLGLLAAGAWLDLHSHPPLPPGPGAGPLAQLGRVAASTCAPALGRGACAEPTGPARLARG